MYRVLQNPPHRLRMKQDTEHSERQLQRPPHLSAVAHAAVIVHLRNPQLSVDCRWTISAAAAPWIGCWTVVEYTTTRNRKAVINSAAPKANIRMAFMGLS
jgi:hypothetical protein